ncbi:phosphomethylpyrimidine kinase [Campylobacter pinnipediorum subsp. pinnipediorum]|uniref:pyridoxal kinase n=1 Tax=Campylobacter pinnipediorum subsp. pinnipediorum TaxID=1660067 RepID=A0AAX0L8D0_9BACT|nr:pyridoxamine kinase [Campylobacter pinnipediorum]OPA74815.1 phosphomethylpyrimidine kinase [Campylobacter pinnipediorum subsp. pinnipediorum]
MKRILTIQDISCVGKCSLGVALPIISSMGIEACVLPTALLSTHTGFSNFTFLDLTDEMDKIVEVWEKENISFDGIYTGFLGNIKQLTKIEGIINKFKNNNELILIDPCMADNGKFYSCFDESFAKAMKNFCKNADIITPNITEACFLTDTKYPKNGYDDKFIDELMDKLKELKTKFIVLKGVSYDEKSCGVLSYDKKENETKSYFHELIDARFSGTGDIFASIVFSKIILGDSLYNTTKIAADFVVDSINLTLKDKTPNHYGVDFEENLPNLIKKL